jgi:hypothetical protein
MKRFLVLALAAFAFAACSEKEETGNQPAQNAELEQSYVAVTFTADDVTRADDGKYEEGRDEERAVKSAYVFFFEDGEAFPVAFDGTASENLGQQNYIEVKLTGEKEDMDNVSDVKDAVLVLQKYKGEYPNQVVAVLNWTPTATSYRLSDLQAAISQLGDDANGYVMSNAVYANRNKEVVDAVALTAANIAKNEEMALANPITIHVERVAAKVEFTSVENGKFKVGKVEDTVDNTETTVYAQIKGFELYNDYQTSYLIKRINPNWADDANFGFTNWNDVDWFRSYWATSLDSKFPNNSFDWNNNVTKLDGYVYCGENTREWSLADDVRTKVIVKAQLVNEKGESVEVVNWWGKDYVGEGNLLKVVANTLKNTYFTSEDGANFVGLTDKDIKCVVRGPQSTNAYEVYFVISDSSKPKTWYKYENGKYTEIKLEDLNKELSAVQPARVYKEGMTYYWLDIKHLGKEGSTTEYGVVRNHVYQVNITDIKGYGTPVYDGNIDFVTPEKPVDINSFVAAQINILSWRVVANDYEI